MKYSNKHAAEPSPKVALFLTIFPYTGLFGIHEYYLGNIKKGILKTLTVNYFSLGWFWDIYLASSGQYKLPNGQCLTPKQKETCPTSSNSEADQPAVSIAEASSENSVSDSDSGAEKPYLSIRLNDVGDYDELVLIPNFGEERPKTERNSYIDFDNGIIYKEWSDAPTDILGYYDTTPIQIYDKDTYRVYDSTKTRILATLSDEMIYFVNNEADPINFRHILDQTCLAYYKPGSVKPAVEYNYCFGERCTALDCVGLTHCYGKEIDGAAAFVAAMYCYDYHCIFSDFFRMSHEEFEKKYPEILPAWLS